MKRYALIFWLLILTIPLSAQMKRGLKGSYDVDSFPTISFVWNSPNPDVLNASQFVIIEKDSAIDFKLSVLPIDKNKIVEKSILILWEDMASHGGQSNFTREVLLRFFNETSLDTSDRFEVAVFDRKRNDTPLLTPLVGQFTGDVSRLTDAIEAHRNNGYQYASFSQSSDLYLAINDGLDLLKKEPVERVGVIVVVTAGLNMKAAGASTEMETVRQYAIRSGIPIYVLKYPLSGNTPEVNMLATSTFGLSSSTMEVATALENLTQQYKSMDDRLRGCDYRFTFTTTVERDGKLHPLQLMENRTRRNLPPFESPQMSFAQWLSIYWWIVVLGVLLVAGGIVGVVLLVKKKLKERDESARTVQEQMMREHEESERRNREMVEGLMREQESKQEAQERAAREAELMAEEARLTKLMQTKHLYPRLQCKAGDVGFAYSIDKVRTTIGRNADNDVAFAESNEHFDNSTVSGYHAEIIFNGAAFEVVNVSRSYTQGIIVNGQLCQRAALRSGDMIGLGEAIITFYV